MFLNTFSAVRKQGFDIACQTSRRQRNAGLNNHYNSMLIVKCSTVEFLFAFELQIDIVS